MAQKLSLSLIEGTFSIVQLPASAEWPKWIGGEFSAVVRTKDELSILCDSRCVPEDMHESSGWRCLMIEGPLPLEMVGVLSEVAAPLARSGVPLFVVSTFNTDYVLVQSPTLPRAIEALVDSGHTVKR